MRTATRISLVAIGGAMIAFAVGAVIAAVIGGDVAQITAAVVTCILLGGLGVVVARAGVRYDGDSASEQ